MFLHKRGRLHDGNTLKLGQFQKMFVSTDNAIGFCGNRAFQKPVIGWVLLDHGCERRRLDDIRLNCQQLQERLQIHPRELAGQFVFDAVILVQNGRRNE